MRYAAVSLLLVVLTPFAVRAQTPDEDEARRLEARRLYEAVPHGTVTYNVPESWPGSWHRTPNQLMATVGLLQLRVIYPVEEGKEPTILFPADNWEASGEERYMVTRLTLSATTFKYTSLKEMWDDRPPRPPDSVILSDVFFGDYWRTIVSKATTNGQPHVGLYCAGLIDKQFAGLSVTLETDGRDPEPFRRAVADFNTVCESLKINGKTQLYTKLNADKILELLGAGAKK